MGQFVSCQPESPGRGRAGGVVGLEGINRCVGAGNDGGAARTAAATCWTQVCAVLCCVQSSWLSWTGTREAKTELEDSEDGDNMQQDNGTAHPRIVHSRSLRERAAAMGRGMHMDGLQNAVAEAAGSGMEIDSFTPKRERTEEADDTQKVRGQGRPARRVGGRMARAGAWLAGVVGLVERACERAG